MVSKDSKGIAGIGEVSEWFLDTITEKLTLACVVSMLRPCEAAVYLRKQDKV